MIIKKVPQQVWVFLLSLVIVTYTSTYVTAAPLEDISLSAETDKVVATIKLTSPISNVRYTPVKKSASLSILFDKVASGQSTETWSDNEVLTSPPSTLIPLFTVKTNLKNIQPKLIIEFSREAEYTVQMGRDGRSIVLGIKTDKVIPRFDGSLPFLPEIEALAPNASEVDKKAAALMLQGRNSLSVGDNFAAIDAFNKLL